MKWHITFVKPIADKTLQVRFEDGTTGQVRFADSFFQGVFSVLKNQREFEKVALEYGAITWPNELDIAPDALYEKIAKSGECVLT